MEHEKDQKKVLNEFQLVSDQKQDECLKVWICSERAINRVSCSCSSFTQTITISAFYEHQSRSSKIVK